MSDTAVSSELKGTVAIVGYPNVGKSTLVNRLTATRAAVVHETPGVTRDRKELLCEWAGERFLLVDTGGVDITDDSPITRGAVAQARAAIEEADLVLFLVDARAGLTPGDAELTDILRRARKPVLLVANKLDDPMRPELAHEFATFGFGEPVEISALHGHGTGDLLDAILERLPGGKGVPVSDEAIRVAVLGRPNVGKSSLLNALLGQERLIVSDVPGTTRDAIDTVLETDERTFVLVDTAGMRRKRKHRQGIEYYSELRALEAANRADVALVLVDASEGVVEQDLTVADVARKAQCSTLVVLSKWDQTTVEIEDVRARLESRLRQRPPILTTSAKTGRGIERLLGRIGRSSTSTLRGSARRSSTGSSPSCAKTASRRRGAASASTSSTARRQASARRATGSSSTTRASSRATMRTGSRTACASGSRSRASPSRSTSSRGHSLIDSAHGRARLPPALERAGGARAGAGAGGIGLHGRARVSVRSQPAAVSRRVATGRDRRRPQPLALAWAGRGTRPPHACGHAACAARRGRWEGRRGERPARAPPGCLLHVLALDRVHARARDR